MSLGIAGVDILQISTLFAKKKAILQFLEENGSKVCKMSICGEERPPKMENGEQMEHVAKFVLLLPTNSNRKQSRRIEETRGESRRIEETRGESRKIEENRGESRKIKENRGESRRIKENRGKSMNKEMKRKRARKTATWQKKGS